MSDSKINSPRNPWLHEYIHTRQNINTTNNSDWFIEGSAYYYAGMFTLQQGKITYQQFQQYLNISETLGRGAILTNIEAEHADPQNTKGRLVAGRTDQRIRLATNGSASLSDIFRRMNAANESISNADFIKYVGSYGDNETKSYIQTATTTRKPVTMWNKKEHKQAFGEIPHESEASTKELDGVSIFIMVLIAVNAVAYSVVRIRRRIA